MSHPPHLQHPNHFPVVGRPLEWDHPVLARLQATLATRRAYRNDQDHLSRRSDDPVIRAAARAAVQALNTQIWQDENRLQQLFAAAVDLQEFQAREQERRRMQQAGRPAQFQGQEGAPLRYWSGLGPHGVYGGGQRVPAGVRFIPAGRRRERRAWWRSDGEGSEEEASDGTVELDGREIKRGPQWEDDGGAGPAELPA